MISTITDLFSLISENGTRAFGIVLTVVGLYFALSELRVYIKHQSSTDQLLMWSMVFTAGVFTVIFNDFIFGALVGISILMLVETYKMWDTPVWGQLMAATTISYLVILAGKAGQIIYDYVVQPEDPNEQIFSLAFNLSFYVFIAVAFLFFGRKFILVSRLSSPQIVYLFLFGMMYGVIIFLQRQEIIFTRDADGFTRSFDYLNLNAEWTERVIFADFGTYEALTVIMIFMYFISGWLLDVLFGVKPVDDPELIAKVNAVAVKMGIKQNIKVGHVSAPILNAFAYGPFFDKRIAFISNDINEFTDSDIRGVVGHELAHSAKNHVMYLLLLSVFELGVKKALGFPATTLDYTFLPDDAVQNISFAWYYAFSYIFLIILLLFVRILEGHADKITKEIGYGEDLSKALFKLEGFYNGVASDFGISVNLLTDRKYTLAERRRFTAQAGRNLFGEILNPTRGSAFANIFQSHPRTSYRIRSLVSDDYGPIRAAFLPYRLMGFGFRKKAIKEMNKNNDKFHELIDTSYLKEYGSDALKEVLKFNPLKEAYEPLIGKNVIAYNRFSKKVETGALEELVITDRITSPIFAIVNGESFDLSKTIVKEYEEQQQYFLRDGSIVSLIGYKLDEKKGILAVVQNGSQDSEEIELSKLGKPVEFLSDLEGKQIIHFDKGVSQLKTLESIELGESWQSTTIKLDGKTVQGSSLIVDFPPVGVEIRKDKLKEQISFLKYLVGKKVILFTKENFDVSLSGTVLSVTEDQFVFEDADGVHEIELPRLEYIIYNDHVVELVTKEHISLFTKIGIWWSNRHEFNYITV